MAFQQIGAIATRLADNATGRRKTDPVHRNSFDIGEDRAKPWRKVGDGSREQWNAHRNALLRTLRDHLREQRCEARKGTDLIKGEERLLPRDVLVLETLLDFFNANTGELFPGQQTIADLVGWCRSAVNDSLQRLKANGYLNWVRRSESTDNKGEDGPQRKQASNAYFFDWRASMSKRVWARFWQLVIAAMKKIGGADTPPPMSRPTRKASPELQALLDRVEAGVARTASQ